MIDLLLVMWIAYYLTRNTVQDLAWKARGEDPPSFRREQQRLKNKENRRPLTDRREGRKFWVNAWEDAWESAGERRARGYEKRRARRQDKWDLEDAEDAAYERNRRIPIPDVDDDEQYPAPGRCEVCDAWVPGDQITAVTITGAGGERHLVWACPRCIAEANRPDQGPIDPKPIDPKPEEVVPPQHQAHCQICAAFFPWLVALTIDGAERWVCPSCRASHADRDKPDPDPAATTTDIGEDDGSYELIPAPAPDIDTDESSGAQVIHLNAWQAPAAPAAPIPQESTVSETTTLNAALAYTTTMAGNAQQGVNSVENSISGLTAGGVTGPTIAALHAAQEALATAAAQFQAAHTALVRHIAVQEQYAANPDAGNKRFVTAD